VQSHSFLFPTISTPNNTFIPRTFKLDYHISLSLSIDDWQAAIGNSACGHTLPLGYELLPTFELEILYFMVSYLLEIAIVERREREVLRRVHVVVV